MKKLIILLFVVGLCVPWVFAATDTTIATTDTSKTQSTDQVKTAKAKTTKKKSKKTTTKKSDKNDDTKEVTSK